MDIGVSPADPSSKFLDGAHVAAFASSHTNKLGFFEDFGVPETPFSTDDLIVIAYQQGYDVYSVGRIPGWNTMEQDTRIDAVDYLANHLADVSCDALKIVSYADTHEHLADLRVKMRDEIPANFHETAMLYEVRDQHVRLTAGEPLDGGVWQPISDNLMVPQRYMDALKRHSSLATHRAQEFTFEPPEYANSMEQMPFNIAIDTMTHLQDLVLDGTLHNQEFSKTVTALSDPLIQDFVLARSVNDPEVSQGLERLAKSAPREFRSQLYTVAAHAAYLDGRVEQAHGLLSVARPADLNLADAHRYQDLTRDLAQPDSAHARAEYSRRSNSIGQEVIRKSRGWSGHETSISAPLASLTMTHTPTPIARTGVA